jgi:hypothetical protein
MSLNLSSFDRAEPADASVEAPAIDAPLHPDRTLFIRALLFGVAGAAIGALINALFIGLTHINIGYLAILVAYLIAKAMNIGSRGQGGRYYQVAAIILTYLAVSAARSALLWWDFHATDGISIPLNFHNLFLLVRYGVLFPFLRFEDSAINGALGLLILFIGFRAAWRMTSGIPGAVRHPFAR